MILERLSEKLVTYRRELHRIPEIGFDLFKTHAYLKGKLIEMGYHPVTIAKTGLYVHIKGISEETIAFRADMDALNVTEKTDSEFQSLHDGKMHACGHDGHMAMLLGFAEYLSEVKTFKKSVLLLFQPAEEGPGGARDIVESGILSQFKVTKIFGFHLYPDLEEGKIGLVEGPMMAQNGEFDVLIKGVSSHGAQPQNGRDAITAAMALMNGYKDIVTKMIDPFVPSIIAIGTINAGEARNIIAQHAEFTGTIRTFETHTYETIKTSMKRLTRSIQAAYELDIKLEIRDFYPPVVNDSRLFSDVVLAIPKASQVLIKPMMFAEDFAFYQQVIPGLFMMLGTKNEANGLIHPLHSCYFNFNETVLIYGVKTYINILNGYHVI